MVVLASDFSPLVTAFNWLILLLIALVSLIPSFFAHPSGPIIAATAMFFNPFLDFRRFVRGFGNGDATLEVRLLYFAPLIVGVASIGIWYWLFRRRQRTKKGA